MIGNIIHPTDANGLVDVTQIQPISLIFSLPQTDFVEIQQQMAKGRSPSLPTARTTRPSSTKASSI